MYSPMLLMLPLVPMARQALAHPMACGPKAPQSPSGKAVYLITNAQSNAVVALPVGQDGLLSAGTQTTTGGAGANGIDGSGQPAAPDALFSQSSLTVAGSNLFAVNAGSNSLTMFAIDPQNATKLTAVGSPVAVSGEFPVTVAASAKHNLVCVGSTGAKAGVSCSTFSAQGLGTMDALRPFNLGQTTPPVGPTNTVSQVFFSEDESTLFSTVKGDPTKNNTGFLAAFPVHGDRKSASVSQNGLKSSPMGTAVLFGTSVISGSKNLFVTDASFGGAVLSVSSMGHAQLKGKGVVDGQKATCWVAVSPATGTAFVTDVATNRIVEMTLDNATIKGEIDLSQNGDPGLIDIRAAGDFIYALSPGNGTSQPAVTVVNALQKTQVQHFSLQGLGVDKNAQGLAVLV